MDEQTQDLAWACLPKEAREEIIKMYKDQDPVFCPGENDVIDWLFGEYNLESDTEPAELLFVERKKVQDAYKAITSDMRRAVLEELFGDKCLPDKLEHR